MPSDTPTHEIAASPALTLTVTPSATAIPFFIGDHQLLFSADGQLWRVSPPFTNSIPLLHDDETYQYGWPIWSPDGNWLAFTRYQGSDCSNYNSSLMISRPDESEMQQISETFSNYNDCTSGMEIFSKVWPLAWSSDSKWLAVKVLDEAHLFSIETGELIPISLPEQIVQQLPEAEYPYVFGWNSFAPDGSRALLKVRQHPNEFGGVDKTFFLVMPLSNRDERFMLTPHDEFRFTYEVTGGVSYNPLWASWSHDGEFIAITDDTANENRLWKIDVDANHWEIIAERLITESFQEAVRASNLEWSPDGRWIAWWGSSNSGSEELYFVDTTKLEIVSSIALVHEEWMRFDFVGWIPASMGANRFMVWSVKRNVKGGGLFLIDPENPNEATLFLEYDQLVSSLPVSPDDLRIISWQPQHKP